MNSPLQGTCRIKSLNINIREKISGQVSLRTYYAGGTATSYYGARFQGSAAEKIKGLQPGATISIVDGEFEEIPSRDGTWTCLIIRDFETIRPRGQYSKTEGR